MCQAHSIQIVAFYGVAANVVVCICVPVLVGSDPSTHLPVLNAVAGEGDGDATKASITSITTPDICPQIKSRGALRLVSVMSMLATLTKPPVELQQCWSISR